MGKEKIKAIANGLMYTPSPKVMDMLEQEYKLLEGRIHKLYEFDVEHLEPLTRIDTQPISTLRKDEIEGNAQCSAFKENAQSLDENGYIVVKIGEPHD